MSGWTDQPITWRSIIRVGLGFAGEYALLALIEDAPIALKVATALCAFAALFVLESEAWFQNKRALFYVPTIVIIAVIWLSFVVYAMTVIKHTYNIKDHLKDMYVSSTILANEERPNSADGMAVFTKSERDWEDESSKWIAANIGVAAQDQFLHQPVPFEQTIPNNNQPILRSWSLCGDRDYDCNRKRLEIVRANLLAIMESKAYDF